MLVTELPIHILKGLYAITLNALMTALQTILFDKQLYIRYVFFKAQHYFSCSIILAKGVYLSLTKKSAVLSRNILVYKKRYCPNDNCCFSIERSKHYFNSDMYIGVLV